MFFLRYSKNLRIFVPSFEIYKHLQKNRNKYFGCKIVLKGNQADTLLSEVIDHGQQFQDGSAQLVQLIHHQRVTLSDEKKAVL